MSTLPQNDQMDYFHPLSKLDPGLKYHKAKQLKFFQIIYLRPSKWLIFALYLDLTFIKNEENQPVLVGFLWSKHDFLPVFHGFYRYTSVNHINLQN